MHVVRSAKQSRWMLLRNRKQRTARRLAQGSSRHQPIASGSDAAPGDERVYEDREDAVFDPSGDRAPASEDTAKGPKARE
jgi:hypothetical protein